MSVVTAHGDHALAISTQYIKWIFLAYPIYSNNSA